MAFPIRGLDPDVIGRLDAAAEARGMSRNAYLVDLLARHAQDIRSASTAGRSHRRRI